MGKEHFSNPLVALQKLLVIVIIVAVLSAASAAICEPVVHSASVDNLLQNPGFENGLNSWNISEGYASYTTDSINSRSGSYCARGEELYEGSLGRLYQDVTALVMPQNLYKIDGWIRTENVTGAVVIALDYVNASNGWTPADGYVAEVGYVSGTANWKYFERYFVMPAMPPDCDAVWFLFDFNNGRGLLWADDVELKQERAMKQPTYSLLFDERRAISDTLNGEYSTIARELEQLGEQLKSTTDVLTTEQLSGHDILVITCPYGDYAQSELEAIKSFVDDGGGLLLMGQWSVSDPTGLNQVAGLFGISFNGSGAVRDPKLGTDAFMPTLRQFNDGHPVCTGMQAMGIYGGRPLSIGNNTALAWGDSDTYGDLNDNRQYDTGEPVGANCIVMAAAESGPGERSSFLTRIFLTTIFLET